MLDQAVGLAETCDPEDADSYGEWADQVMEWDWSGLDESERKELTSQVARRDKEGIWYEVHGIAR